MTNFKPYYQDKWVMILTQIRTKIDKPSKWCAYWSESDNGKRLGVDGAIWVIAGYKTVEANEIFRILAEVSPFTNNQWSDFDRVAWVGPHAAVIKMIDAAIAKCCSQEVMELKI